MNQCILFSDFQYIDKDKQAVGFDAQQSGALIYCFVLLTDLQTHYHCKLKCDEAILAVFSQHRFDYEELAEKAIEGEDFNAQGEVWVS